MKTSCVNASSAPQPSGGYSQAVEVSGAQRLLFISGQIPESAGGEVPEDFAQLTAAGMTGSNLIKVTIFLSSREFASANREIRQRFLGSHTAALTVIITGIFDQKWLLEIEAIAAA
jgi:2-iminobutanoate/2-iminopropanoate deaminase